MTDFMPQSTDQLPTDTSPDTDRILYRGRLNVAPTDYTSSGSYLYASKSIDMGQFRVTNGYNVEVWMTDGTEIYKAPFTSFTGTPPSIFINCVYFLQGGSKFSNTSTRLVINVMNTTGNEVNFYFQIKSSPTIGDLFPLLT